MKLNVFVPENEKVSGTQQPYCFPSSGWENANSFYLWPHVSVEFVTVTVTGNLNEMNSSSSCCSW